MRTLIWIGQEVKNLPALFMKILLQTRNSRLRRAFGGQARPKTIDSWLTYLDPMIIRGLIDSIFFME